MPIDAHGIKKIYPDSIFNAAYWSLSSVNDPQINLDNGNLSGLQRNGDVYNFNQGNDNGVLNVLTQAGYNSSLIENNHAQAAAKGYMMTPKDWKNIEVTVFINLHSTIDDYFTIKARGGKHYGTQNCEGFAYNMDLSYSGNIRMSKEQFHQRFFYTPIQNVTGSIDSKWTGVKFCIFNTYHPTQNQKQGVIMETHLDLNANGNWQKLYSYTDYGNWGDQDRLCGGTPDQIGIWGGPVVILKWTNTTSFSFRYLSIREIDPYTVYNEGGSNTLAAKGVGGLGRTGSGSPANQRGLI